MRKAIRSLAYQVAPGAAERFFVRRQRRHIEQLEKAWDLPRINDAVVRHFNAQIAGGPFAGMKYENNASGSTLAPKLIGSYEAEISPWIETLCAAGLTRVVDVGCAEGYYAVGMAWRNSGVTVVAYDIDDVARQRCVALAELNGVGNRVSVRSRCDPAALSEAIIGRTLVVCDVEGYEDQLLDPFAAPNLASAFILVELHDRFVPGLTERLKRRFTATHEWSDVSTRERVTTDYPAIDFLPEADRAVALSEKRGGAQQWALLVPHGFSLEGA